jgi:hypothetical protein
MQRRRLSSLTSIQLRVENKKLLWMIPLAQMMRKSKRGRKNKRNRTMSSLYKILKSWRKTSKSGRLIGSLRLKAWRKSFRRLIKPCTPKPMRLKMKKKALIIMRGSFRTKQP